MHRKCRLQVYYTWRESEDVTLRQNMAAPCCSCHDTVHLVWALQVVRVRIPVTPLILLCTHYCHWNTSCCSSSYVLTLRSSQCIKKHLTASKFLPLKLSPKTFPVLVPCPLHCVSFMLISSLSYLCLCSASLHLQRWCMPWSLVTWQPLSRGCIHAGPSTTPEPKTSRTSYVSIICHRASSSECWNIFRRPGRSTTASTVTRYRRRTHTSAALNSSLSLNLCLWHPRAQHVGINTSFERSHTSHRSHIVRIRAHHKSGNVINITHHPQCESVTEDNKENEDVISYFLTWSFVNDRMFCDLENWGFKLFYFMYNHGHKCRNLGEMIAHERKGSGC